MSQSKADILISSGLLAVGLLLYATGLYSLGSGPSAAPVALHIAILAAMCVVGCLRSTRPALGLALGTALFAVDCGIGPTVPVWIVCADLLYAAVRHGSPRLGRVAAYGTGLGVVVLTVVVLVTTRQTGFAVGALIVTALFFGTSLWWGQSIRRQVEITRMERERARAQQILADLDRDAAVAHERNSMARDLHDVIAGHLSSIAIHSEAALSLTLDPVVRQAITAIRTGSTAALSEMRSMIDVLDAVDPSAASDALTSPHRLADLDIVVGAARAVGTPVSVCIDVGDALPTVVDHAAYRIAQEAVTNAMKHAPSCPIEVVAERGAGGLTLTIRNPVTSSRPPTVSGVIGRGLANMQHRVHLLGGTFDAGVVDHQWVVSARVPVGAT